MSVPLASQSLRAGKQAVTVRGQQQDLYCYPGASTPPKGKVLFLTGDGGWRGFAVDVTKTISSWGYDACGMDTNRYLKSFTPGKATLKETDVMGDLRTIAAWMKGNTAGKVIYIGWSEGANLGVLAGAPLENKEVFQGMIVIGLCESGILGWRWQDNITWITKREPDEPRYQTGPYLPKIAPLPFFMIHATGDEYTAVDRARKMFEAVKEPKLLNVIEARNHHFDGGRDEFFRVLKAGCEWVSANPR